MCGKPVSVLSDQCPEAYPIVSLQPPMAKVKRTFILPESPTVSGKSFGFVVRGSGSGSGFLSLFLCLLDKGQSGSKVSHCQQLRRRRTRTFSTEMRPMFDYEFETVRSCCVKVAVKFERWVQVDGTKTGFSFLFSSCCRPIESGELF